MTCLWDVLGVLFVVLVLHVAVVRLLRGQAAGLAALRAHVDAARAECIKYSQDLATREREYIGRLMYSKSAPASRPPQAPRQLSRAAEEPPVYENARWRLNVDYTDLLDFLDQVAEEAGVLERRCGRKPTDIDLSEDLYQAIRDELKTMFPLTRSLRFCDGDGAGDSLCGLRVHTLPYYAKSCFRVYAWAGRP